MNKSFTAWLKTQKEDDTRIGDLAREMLEDDLWPRWGRTKRVFWEHLEDLKACDAAFDTLDIAWKQYQREKTDKMS